MANAVEVLHFGDKSPDEWRNIWAQDDERSKEAKADALNYRDNLENFSQAVGGLAIDSDIEWMKSAECRNRNAIKLFFSPAHYERKDEKLEREQKAKAICQICPVLKECREYAIERKEPQGIWGGLTEAERKELH